jgi:hypothetical protein
VAAVQKQKLAEIRMPGPERRLDRNCHLIVA